MQRIKIFWGENDPWGVVKPTDEERHLAISSDNPNSPFSKFVGNVRAVKKMQAAAWDALGRADHRCRELAFSLFGPASSGKTTLARLFADVVQLPFVEIQPKAIKTSDELLKEIDRVLGIEGVPLVEVRRRNYFILPPSIIFIDEVHALSDGMVQSLLKATEYNDATLVTESGKTVNCFNVCWMIATTDEGRLFDAFRSRFTPVMLTYLTKKEVAHIVKLNHDDLSEDVCELVAHYTGRIPRKALEFARYMKLIRQMNPGKSWEDVAREVAQDEGIDEFGMSAVHLKILQALKDGAIAKNRMVNVTGRKLEEVERYIMPVLLTSTDDQPAMVEVLSRGYSLTEAGFAELVRRGEKIEKVSESESEQ